MGKAWKIALAGEGGQGVQSGQIRSHFRHALQSFESGLIVGVP
jgi:hypothetical protein